MPQLQILCVQNTPRTKSETHLKSHILKRNITNSDIVTSLLYDDVQGVSRNHWEEGLQFLGIFLNLHNLHFEPHSSPELVTAQKRMFSKLTRMSSNSAFEPTKRTHPPNIPTNSTMTPTLCGFSPFSLKY